MTTTVTVLIAGNKNCEVRVVNEKGENHGGYPTQIVPPKGFTSVCIYDGLSVSVKEIGDFLT